jgi:transposase
MEGVIARGDKGYAGTEEVSAVVAGAGDAAPSGERKGDLGLALNAAAVRVGQRTGVNPDTLRGWMKQGAIDAGDRPGTTLLDAARTKQPKAENRELKRANGILLAASPSSRGSSTRDRAGEDIAGVTQDSEAGSQYAAWFLTPHLLVIPRLVLAVARPACGDLREALRTSAVVAARSAACPCVAPGRVYRMSDSP